MGDTGADGLPRARDGRVLSVRGFGAGQPSDIPTEEIPCPCCGGKDFTPEAEGRDFEYATSWQTWRFCRCSACQCLFLNPRPKLDQFARIYPPWYYSLGGEGGGFVDAVWRFLQRRKARSYLRLTGKKSGRALDVGCGDGRFLASVARAAGKIWRCEGVEVGENGGRAARKAGITVHAGLVEDLPLERGSYDLVWMQQVIEHVPFPPKTLARVQELLAPGGTLILETPDLGGWDARLFRRRYWGGYHFPRHFVLWDRAGLRKIVEGAGLKVTRQRALLSPVFWAFSMRNRAIDKRASKVCAKWWSASNPLVMAEATWIDLWQSKLFGNSSNQQLVARKDGG
ncbi:MAG: class I SAM-dependent methyltransferase [Planctomycetes bacterium]|nr:class I SAM-dependent methyltransferase [Planctomycetota bacterium]